MTKFYGNIGYVDSVETPAGSGIWVEVPVEYPYAGDVVYDNSSRAENEYLNDGLRINNRISVLVDAYASRNVHNIRYVYWMGSYWVVSTVEVKPPRLLLNLGKVYNGPTA